MPQTTMISANLCIKYQNQTLQTISQNYSMLNLKTNNLPVLRSASTNNFIIPKPNKEIFKQSITYAGPIIWNSLSENLKSAKTINSFHCNFIKMIKS